MKKVSKTQLKTILKVHGLKNHGNKNELIKRLIRFRKCKSKKKDLLKKQKKIQKKSLNFSMDISCDIDYMDTSYEKMNIYMDISDDF